MRIKTFFILLLLLTSSGAAWAAQCAFDLKYNTASQVVPFIITDTAEVPQTAWTLDSVTFKEGAEGTWTNSGTIAKVSCATVDVDWEYCEEDTTKAPGEGFIQIPQNITDTKGLLEYKIF